MTILVLTMLVSCQDNFSSQMIGALESFNYSPDDSSYLAIKDVFNFNWDTLYIFDSMLYPDEISSTIGMPCDCDMVSDGSSLAIFILGDSIIEKELIRMDDYSFVKLRENGVSKIGWSAKFKVERKDLNGNYHYYLFKTN